MKYGSRLFANLLLLAAFLLSLGVYGGSFSVNGSESLLAADPVTRTVNPTSVPLSNAEVESDLRRETAAREVIEAALLQTVGVQGAYPPELQNVSFEGHWAYGTVASPDGFDPVTVTAHLMPDGNWNVVTELESRVLFQKSSFAPESASIFPTTELAASLEPYETITSLIPFTTANTIRIGTSVFSNASDTYEFLTAEMAYDAAISRMQKQIDWGNAPHWDDAKLRQPIPLYDLGGKVIAYLFEVHKDKTPAGYLTVYAWNIPNPVLEFATNGLSPVASMREAAEEERMSSLVEGAPLLYLGPITYAYEISSSDDARTLLDLRTGRTFIITDTKTKETSPFLKNTHLTSTDNLSYGPQTLSGRVTISDIPDWKQFWGEPFGYNCYSGCSPTSATNIMQYWENRGLTGLTPSNSYI